MIVVDTNVLSETLKREAAPAVLAWLADRADELAIAAVTAHELQYGVLRLPPGRRRTELGAGVRQMLDTARDAGRLLPYNDAVARVHAELRAERATVGRPSSVEDGMIAAIAIEWGAAVATRNVHHFEGFGLQVIDPWKMES